MTGYSVTLAESARKELRSLPAHVAARIQPKLRQLIDNPRPHGCKKLKGYESAWRLRVGDYRIVYTVNDSSRHVDVSSIAHRKRVYET